MSKTIKILLISVIAFASFLITTKVEAASASISASKNSVTVGDSVNVTITFNAAAWNLKVSGTGVSSDSYVGNTDDAENTKTTKTLKVDTSASGTKTIKLTGDVSDGTTGATTQINKSVTITVNKASSSSSNNNNSSSTSNSSNSNTTTTTSTTTTTETTPSFTSVNETVYATSKANVRSSYSTSSSIIGSLKIGDSVTRIGVGSNGWSKITYNGQTAYISSSLISKTKPEEKTEDTTQNTVTEQKEEENKDDKLLLNSLKIDGYDLSPEFSAETYDYEVNVENEVEKLEINAISDDKDAKVEISGNEKLEVGKNKITITVSKTGVDEKTTYAINVTRADEEETEAVVKINQDLLNEEIDRINSNLKIKSWTIRGIIIFVTILIIIMIILRYLTVRKEVSDDEYVNIKEKFNIPNDFEYEDIDEETETEVEETEQQEEANENVSEKLNEEVSKNNTNIEYKIKRSKKSKGKHF